MILITFRIQSGIQVKSCNWTVCTKSTCRLESIFLGASDFYAISFSAQVSDSNMNIRDMSACPRNAFDFLARIRSERLWGHSMCILACFFLRGRSFLAAPNDFEAALGPSWPCFTSHQAVRRHFGLIVGKLGGKETPSRIALYCSLCGPASPGVIVPVSGGLFGTQTQEKKNPKTDQTNE